MRAVGESDETKKGSNCLLMNGYWREYVVDQNPTIAGRETERVRKHGQSGKHRVVHRAVVIELTDWNTNWTLIVFKSSSKTTVRLLSTTGGSSLCLSPNE